MNILVSICQSVTRCPPERSEGVGTCNQPWSSPSPHLQNEQSAVLQWPVTSTAIGAIGKMIVFRSGIVHEIYNHNQFEALTVRANDYV